MFHGIVILNAVKNPLGRLSMGAALGNSTLAHGENSFGTSIVEAASRGCFAALSMTREAISYTK